MKKFDGFLITILIIVVGLTGIYYYAHYYLSYFDENPELNAKYERKFYLDQLVQKIKLIEMQSKTDVVSRGVASTKAVSGDLEISTDSKIAAENFFIEAKIKCYTETKELECLKIIEEAVVHYPDSVWTGENLVLLTDFYYRTKRIGLARDILKILKQDFKDSQSIQEKVIIMERQII